MAFFTSPQINPNSAIITPPSTSLHLNSSFRNLELRLWKKRRFKRKPKLFFTLRNSLEPSSSSSFDFLSLLPLNWVPPAALGFASALAISLSNQKPKIPKLNPDSRVSDIGEWVLFSSPTPFNRFVFLRCGSISFEGGEEYLEDVSERLVKEEKHYVRLDSGRIQGKNDGDGDEVEERESVSVEYQRVCVGTDDGGVISLDWPSNLDLSEERGLDTTVLLVPGTAEGSMDDNVRSFVAECLRRGLFPVVMNPRGCAGSPLTTARLFTAADSDDICSAIQFVTRARPWSTLTGVGWGYGANMLTKYLAEAGEKTPLTAVTCIDNPFDLDEATRTSPYSTTIDNKLKGGLIDILKSNKELFQGWRKGFDVDKALAAESLRDFEKAISMVPYGFDTIEEFYSSSSTRLLVGDLKIPVLFVQNDNGTVPLFSIPRGPIAENPFTSLLLCSCLPSNVAAISWYQKVAIEWLTAVELGLLKGRHPLLQDIDVTINPSKGLALMEGRTSNTSGRLDRVLDLGKLDNLDAYVDPMKELLTETDAIASTNPRFNQKSLRNQALGEHVLSETNGAFPDGTLKDEDSTKDTGTSQVESDAGQVLPTAQVVMNMLDVTMPGTLKEEDKKKVLAAVDQGETLIKALQDAVPEDVRGKLTSSVSDILQAQGKSLNFDKLLSINRRADAVSGLKSKNNANLHTDSKTDSNVPPSDIKASEDTRTDGNDNDQVDADKLGSEDSGTQPPKTSVRSDISESKAVNSDDDTGLTKGLSESQNIDEKLDNEASAKKVNQLSESNEDGSESAAKMNSSSNSAGVTNDGAVMQSNRSQDDETNQKESSIPGKVGESKDLSDEQIKSSSAADSRPADTNEATASPTSESQVSEKRDDDKIKGEIVQPPADQNRASTSTDFSVSQALDALTGMDDSTQVAVNSVFSVLEDMIAQLEEKNRESIVNQGSENKDVVNGSVIEKDCTSNELQLEKQTDVEDEEDTIPLDMEVGNGHNSNRSTESSSIIAASKEKNIEKLNLIANKPEATNIDGMMNISKNSFYMTLDPNVSAIVKESFLKYILAEIQKVKYADRDSTNPPFLDYTPELGNYLLLKQPGGLHVAVINNNNDRKKNSKLLQKDNVTDSVIEPSYVILDKEQEEQGEELVEKLHDKPVSHDNHLEESKSFVKSTLLDSLKVEVSRRLNALNMEDMEAALAADMEGVADAVYLAVQHDEEQNQKLLFSGYDPDFQEWSRLNGNRIIEVITEAVQNSSYLKKVLPIGVIVGSILAALRNCFDLASEYCNNSAAGLLDLDQDHISVSKPEDQLRQDVVIQLPIDGIDHDLNPGKNLRKDEGSVALNTLDEDDSDEDDRAEAKSKSLSQDTLMVGAVTAALGASALLSNQQESLMGHDNSETSEEKHMTSEPIKLEEMVDNNNQNIVTSLAEKAMSVAAPVVPTKEDGAVDQERIVAMLAELGQRGGVLRLVGKLALLWGGFRGAMNLTDRLISFFRVADRPLLHRVLGFSCMVLVLWSPVLVPLLPILFQNFTTHSSSRIAELTCVVGLYTAVTILIMLWGKRIRGYEHPLKQYGLDLTSSRKVQHFLIGLVGGVLLVVSIHSLNAFLGFVNLTLPSNFSSSSLNLTAKIKAHGQLFLLAGQGFLMAAGVAFVEELLFRSWLLEEIAVDLGYHPGILISGLAFALSQRSWQAVPGLWLLSMCLSGVRLRKDGSLFIPIGLRTGLMASSYILQTGSFLVYLPKFPWWVVGTHPFQPFSGVVGLLVALLLAVVLYPRQPGLMERIPRTIRA